MEFKRRDQAERSIVPLAEVQARVQAELAALRAEIAAGVVPVVYPES